MARDGGIEHLQRLYGLGMTPTLLQLETNGLTLDALREAAPALASAIEQREAILERAGGLLALLSQPELASVRQGCELLISLDDAELMDFLLGGCEVDEEARLCTGAELQRWVLPAHRLWVALLMLGHTGRLSSSQRLRGRWEGHGSLDLLPAHLEALHLEVCGRAIAHGAAPPDWSQLGHLTRLRALSIEVRPLSLKLDSLAFTKQLRALETLTLYACRLPSSIDIHHPTLTSLTLRQVVRGHLVLNAPRLRDLALESVLGAVVHVNGAQLRTLHLHRCANFRSLRLSDCPRLEALTLGSTGALGHIELGMGCVIVGDVEDTEVVRTP